MIPRDPGPVEPRPSPRVAPVAAAVFSATRNGLVGTSGLRGAAELARRVVRRADATFAVVAVTAQRVRRVDGWLDADGCVTHPAADVDEPVLGSLCDRRAAPELAMAVVAALVGQLPERATTGPIVVTRPGALTPDSLPRELTALTVVGRRSASDAPLLAIGATADGVLVAELDGPDVPTEAIVLRPSPGTEIARRVDTLLAPTAHRLADLLDR